MRSTSVLQSTANSLAMISHQTTTQAAATRAVAMEIKRRRRKERRDVLVYARERDAYGVHVCWPSHRDKWYVHFLCSSMVITSAVDVVEISSAKLVEVVLFSQAILIGLPPPFCAPHKMLVRLRPDWRPSFRFFFFFFLTGLIVTFPCWFSVVMAFTRRWCGGFSLSGRRCRHRCLFFGSTVNNVTINNRDELHLLSTVLLMNEIDSMSLPMWWSHCKCSSLSHLMVVAVNVSRPKFNRLALQRKLFKNKNGKRQFRTASCVSSVSRGNLKKMKRGWSAILKEWVPLALAHFIFTQKMNALSLVFINTFPNNIIKRAHSLQHHYPHCAWKK